MFLSLYDTNKQNKNNELRGLSEWTIPAEWTPLVGEVNANFLRMEGVVWSAQQITKAVFSIF
jgi:hypothetical protein